MLPVLDELVITTRGQLDLSLVDQATHDLEHLLLLGLDIEQRWDQAVADLGGDLPWSEAEPSETASALDAP